jgi:HSP20 family protein
MDTRLVKPEFPLLRRLGREFDWFFDRFGFDRPVFETPGMWTPYLEVYQKNNEFFVKAELPGLKKEDITVEIREGELTIAGERKEEVEKKEKDVYRSERSYGSFLRTIALPEAVKIENASATVKDGVLEVKMPMTKLETARRRVEITEGSPADKNAKHAA